MKSLFIILLAGYAVRSDENNYYVIEMQDVPPTHTTLQTPTKKPFNVYWNVPTMQCASKKIHFDNLFENFGIIQNENDRFKGEKVTILYDPGLFPALFKNESGGKIRFRNGGVPQEGNLEKHLDEFKKELERSIPDEKFTGIGIIDFESWRPQFRQNFGVLQPYKDVSFEIERKLHWWWKEAWIKEEAKRRFEEAARTFMQSTLSVAKKLRPRARWGFYGFPYCFNMASNNLVEACAKGVPQENDEISWLWSESTALYPSVYSSSQLRGSQLAALLRGRLREAARCAGAHGDILPYFWYRYRDAGFLTETDLSIALSTLYQSAAAGIIIWGSSNDVNTVEKCTHLKYYVQNVLGPAIAKYTKRIIRDNEESDDITTFRPDIYTKIPATNLFSNKDINLDPEFHWMPPENYTQDLKDNVEQQINNKFSQNVTNDHSFTVLQNNSVLIDLILNAVLNSVENVVTTSDNPKTKLDKKYQLQKEFIVSTTEINVKPSTDTSQITSSVVTSNPLLKIMNNTNNTEVESQTIVVTSSETSLLDEATTTEVTLFETEDTDLTNADLLTEAETIDFVNETKTTTKTDNEMVTETTEDDYDVTLDGDDDDEDFYNSDTFILFLNKETTVTIDDQDLSSDSTNADFTKNEKKTQIYTQELWNNKNPETSTEISTTKENDILELSSIAFSNADSFTLNNIIFMDEDGNEPITESGIISITTEYELAEKNTISTEILYSMETTTEENVPLYSSKDNDERNDIVHISKYDANSYILSTTPTDKDGPEATNLPNELRGNEYNTENLETSSTTEANATEETLSSIVLETSKMTESEDTEVSTTMVPSTEQVVFY